MYDEVRIQAADLAQAVAKAAPQEAARARAFADEAILAAGEALHSAADVSKVESQRAEHQTNALASALEVYNWNVTAANTMDASLQAIAIAMQEAVHSAHVTRREVTDAEAKADSDVREDDDEVIMDDPHEAAQSMMNKREMYAGGLVAARESIKAITDAAASLRSVVKKEASAKAARHAEASAWAAGAATGESPHGMGMLRVSPQQKLKLRMRWRERRCEFQVCSWRPTWQHGLAPRLPKAGWPRCRVVRRFTLWTMLADTLRQPALHTLRCRSACCGEARRWTATRLATWPARRDSTYCRQRRCSLSLMTEKATA